MRMPIGNLPQVVLEFTDSVLMPAASAKGGALPFTVGIVAGLAARRAPEMVSQYLPVLKSLGVVDEQNRIDVDLLHEEAAKALSAHPLTVAGYTPDSGDLDKLREIMNRYGE